MNITSPTAWGSLALGLYAFLPAHAAPDDKARGESDTVADAGGVRSIDGTRKHSNEDESDRDPNIRVDVVVDLTEAGKKIAHPTSEKPAYYFPLFYGYKEFGSYLTFYQRPPPTTDEVEKMIVKTLAQQGYLIMTHEHHPSLVLTFTWGYVNLPSAPKGIGMIGFPDPMTQMVAGDKYYEKSELDPRVREAFDAGEVPRNFLMVSALDFTDWLHKKMTLLWRAHVSTSYWGHYFDQDLPTLIATGAPMFGRETDIPQMINVPVMPTGHVILGMPEVKDYATKPAAPGK